MLSGYDIGLWLADSPWSSPELWLTWHVTTSWVKCMLCVNQPGKRSLPFLRARQMSGNLCYYMEINKRQTRAVYGCLVIGHRLSLRSVGCTPALSVTQQRHCSCIRRVWRYIIVMPFTLYLYAAENNRLWRLQNDVVTVVYLVNGKIFRPRVCRPELGATASCTKNRLKIEGREAPDRNSSDGNQPVTQQYCIDIWNSVN